MIVLEGMKNTVALAQLCSRHQISQSQYYNWRDRLLKDGAKLFENGGPDKQVERLEKKNKKLTHLVGELTIELKKTDELLEQW